MLIYENTSGELKYSSDSRFNGETTNEAVARLRDQKQQFISFALQEYEVIIWTCSDSIDEIVQAETARKIHSYEFGNDVYIWVNEVINYNGGENYASPILSKKPRRQPQHYSLLLLRRQYQKQRLFLPLGRRRISAYLSWT